MTSFTTGIDVLVIVTKKGRLLETRIVGNNDGPTSWHFGRWYFWSLRTTRDQNHIPFVWSSSSIQPQSFLLWIGSLWSESLTEFTSHIESFHLRLLRDYTRPIHMILRYRPPRRKLHRLSNATGLDIFWFGVDKPKSKLDPVYPI
jgi:hypothetical protein